MRSPYCCGEYGELYAKACFIVKSKELIERQPLYKKGAVKTRTREKQMTYITTQDNTKLYVKDWGSGRHYRGINTRLKQ